MKQDILTLGLESSCDETSVAIVKNGKHVLSNIIFSQIKEHQKYGGVVPEAASRLHVMNIIPCLQEALKTAACSWSDIDLVCSTMGPGLLGALAVGLNSAKAISLSLNKPFIAIHHIEGHLYANLLDNDLSFKYPSLALIASGGHTQIILINQAFEYQLIGNTLDDAIGEAFDKSARIVGLPYPGGPIIDKLAQKGDPKRFNFPKVTTPNPLDFSFSGLKTFALKLGQENHLLTQEKECQIIADFCASLQFRLIEELINKLLLASKTHQVNTFIIAGGVSANSELRKRLNELNNYEIQIPSLKYCTDNAAMIAAAGYARFLQGETSPLNIEPKANLRLCL